MGGSSSVLVDDGRRGRVADRFKRIPQRFYVNVPRVEDHAGRLVGEADLDCPRARHRQQRGFDRCPAARSVERKVHERHKLLPRPRDEWRWRSGLTGEEAEPSHLTSLPSGGR